ncbi:RHS repeat protein, partial [Acinetobacter pittii]|nr:RHS repeat protein [Acinetobacter pittii]
LNPYIYASGNPVSNVDSTGLCTNDPYCSGSWGQPLMNFSADQSALAIQRQFNFGSGTYIVDPMAWGLDRVIDIGTQLNNSALGGKSFANVLKGIPYGVSTPFSIDKNFSFNGNYINSIRLGTWPMGRLAGTISGEVTKYENGSFKVHGQVKILDDFYSWKIDGNSSQNKFIKFGGSLPTNYTDINGNRIQWRDASSSYSTGQMPMKYGRIYNFDSVGFWKK